MTFWLELAEVFAKLIGFLAVVMGLGWLYSLAQDHWFPDDERG